MFISEEKTVLNEKKTMLHRMFGLVVIIIAASAAEGQLPRPTSSSDVITCAQATETQPYAGTRFEGYVSNSDYRFSALIPRGLTGWTGVAERAPFHGFSIFLDDRMNACIVFEIHVRVNEEDSPKKPASAVPVTLGSARGWQSVTQGTIGDANILNIRTDFSHRQGDQIDDGEIVLITPLAEAGEAKAVYKEFIQSLEFRGGRTRLHE